MVRKYRDTCQDMDADHVTAGIPSSSISKISIQPTFEKNLPPSESDTSRILEYTVVSSLSNHRVTRRYDSVIWLNKLIIISLKPIDIVVLKKLSDVVNVVPVIAKSDSLTLEERMAFKERIKEEFAFHNLRMYPYDDEEQDQEERAMNSSIKDLIPFAVVGSENSIVVNGRQVRGRQNRWGVINVEDEHHCEFVALRDFLTRTHLQDLIETTSQIHYEVFRAKQLLALKENNATGHSGSRPISPSAERELSRQSQRMTMNGY